MASRKKDIVIDALCMTISSEPTGALVTLETVRRVRQELWLQYDSRCFQYFLRITAA